MNIVEKVKIALKNANETEFLQLLLSVTNQELKAVFDADKWTLCQICELGYSSTLEHLLDLQILNVNDTYYDVSETTIQSIYLNIMGFPSHLDP